MNIFPCAILDILDWYEPYHVSNWRQKALDHIFEHICADDKFTKGISIGPVSIATCLIPFSAKEGYFKTSVKRNNKLLRHIDRDVLIVHYLLQISKVIQMLVRFHRNGLSHPAFKQHQERVHDYLWLVKCFWLILNRPWF